MIPLHSPGSNTFPFDLVSTSTSRGPQLLLYHFLAIEDFLLLPHPPTSPT